MKALTNLNVTLTEVELMQLANHPPKEPVEVYILVDNCASRMSDDDVNNIVDLTKSFFEV